MVFSRKRINRTQSVSQLELAQNIFDELVIIDRAALPADSPLRSALSLGVVESLTPVTENTRVSLEANGALGQYVMAVVDQLPN